MMVPLADYNTMRTLSAVTEDCYGEEVGSFSIKQHHINNMLKPKTRTSKKFSPNGSFYENEEQLTLDISPMKDEQDLLFHKDDTPI